MRVKTMGVIAQTFEDFAGCYAAARASRHHAF